MTTLLTKIAMGLYGVTASILTPVIKRHLIKRISRGKEHPDRYREKLGFTQSRRPNGRLIWIHAASVGESLSILPLISALNQQDPNLNFLVTTGTTTSASLMEKRLPVNAIHQFIPIDTPAATERFLSHWKPDLAMIVESELWPQLIFRTSKHKIPLLLINGRMSNKSTTSWKRAPFFIQDLLNSFRVILAQSGQDTKHFKELGAQNVVKSSNLKFAAKPLSYSQQDLEDLKKAVNDRPVWFASSTHKSEEIYLAQVHEKLRKIYPSLLCIIAPRHPERGPEITQELRSNNFKVAMRSTSDPITPDTSIYLADTLGELGLFYALSSIVVIGGSLLRKGGQNLLEPARQDCAIICGPEMQNFEAICDEMLAANAVVKLKTADQLEDSLKDILRDTTKRQELADTAAKYTGAKGKEIETIASQVLAALSKK